jgi:1-acyl-sn-glycerol-3-phosphate acyltransferase
MNNTLTPIGKFFAIAYALLGFLLFWITLVLLYPFFLIAMWRTAWNGFAFYVNRVWSHSVYRLMLAQVETVMRFQCNKKQPYVYCANHTSYLDISLMCYAAPQFVKFIGKSSLAKVPLFGYMFKKLHILVDRKNSRSRYDSFEQAKKAIDDGYSVFIFPEGGIYSKNPPQMTAFKDGAFRLAIEKKVPIVPVTIPYHWLMLPGISPYLRYHKIKVIFHEAIPTTNLTINDVEALKKKTFDIITNELKAHFPEKFTEVVDK